MKRSALTLRKKLDKIFSIFIRHRDEGKCYTCSKVVEDWRDLQCGHFVPRQYLATRYDEVNCHAQCYACNMLYNGQPSRFAQRLEREFGIGTVDSLESKRTKVIKDFPYEYWIEIYKEKTRDFSLV